MKVVCILPPDPDRDVSAITPEGWDMTVIESVDQLTDDLVDGIEAMITTAHGVITRETLERLKGIKLVQQLGVGVDSIDIEAARELGIPVANVSRANNVAVAEYVIMAIIYVMRRMAYAIELDQQGIIAAPVLIAKGCHEIREKKLGIVGFGAIGYEVAVRAKALGMAVLSYDVVEPMPDEQELGVRRVPFDSLIAQSDVVTLHVPLTEETRNLIGRDELAKMKEGACLINASRGGVVDEAALAESLHSGHLAGAAVDVTVVEPVTADNPLVKAPNILLTPHIAGVTTDSVNYMVQKSFANCFRVFMGEEPVDRIC